jgi:RIO kinase 1
MYHDCNLVHGDLSEYNLLWHEGRAKIIDVSQSVEHAHPYASDFLRKDISNVTDFFRKKGMRVLSNYELFRYVTCKDFQDLSGPAKRVATGNPEAGTKSGASVKALRDILTEMLVQSELRAEEEEELEAAVEPIAAELADLDRGERENKAMQEDSIFMQSYIPTSLNDLANPHAEMARLVNGQRERGYVEAVSRMLGKDVGTKCDDIDEAEDDSSEASCDDESDHKDGDDECISSSSSD